MRSSTFYLSLAGILAASFETSHAWVRPLPPSVSSVKSRSALFSSSEGVESFSLKISQNHEEEGEKMAVSITAWLDAEWMPQEVHRKMADSAKSSYIKCREGGEDDLMAIMTTIADDLTANWAEYDAEAFIGCWDISNYVSDYLVKASGSETCKCSSEIF